MREADRVPVKAVYYQDENGKCPMEGWLQELKKKQPKVLAKCNAVIEMLEEHGHKLDRPDAAYLRDDIYELRISLSRVQYRILYFFYERKGVVLTHGIRKEEAKVPIQEIEKAVERRKKFIKSPKVHVYERKSW